MSLSARLSRNCVQSASSDLLFFGGEGPIAVEALLEISACCFNLSYSSLVMEIFSSGGSGCPSSASIAHEWAVCDE